MSPYERRRRSNVLPGVGTRFPSNGHTGTGQRDSGHLVVPLSARWSDTEPTSAGACGGTRLWANHGGRGVCEPALKPLRSWVGPWRKGQGFKPDLGNPAVRDYRGASGNVVMAEMGTHPATERARLVTLCAGINRHEVENARVLRARISDPLGPEFCVGHREVHDEA